MSTSGSTDTSTNSQPRWTLIGPGLVVAATGVGAIDLVATLIAGSMYGYALLWCVVVGCLMKIVLVEGVGRYTLASGKTIFEGWSTLGWWTTAYFAPYIHPGTPPPSAPLDWRADWSRTAREAPRTCSS